MDDLPIEVRLLLEKFGDRVTHGGSVSSWPLISLSAEDAFDVCRMLCSHADLMFDYPADMCGQDTGDEILLWYRLTSMSRHRSIVLQVHVDRDEPSVRSVTAIWPGMNWHERECFDLFGVRFVGHPDALDPTRMRILLPEDWIGHPFRKDYQPIFTGNPLHGPQETN